MEWAGASTIPHLLVVLIIYWIVPGGSVVKIQLQFLGWEDALEREMATHSNILAWRIPWTEDPGGLQSLGLQSRTQLSKYTCYVMFSHWGPESGLTSLWGFLKTPPGGPHEQMSLTSFMDQKNCGRKVSVLKYRWSLSMGFTWTGASSPQRTKGLGTHQCLQCRGMSQIKGREIQGSSSDMWVLLLC